MLGRPPSAQKDWDQMYLYERVHHLVDHTANFIIAKVNWWLPSVAAGVALSIFIIGGPEAPQQGMSLVVPSFVPVVRAPPFASPSPEGHGDAAPEEEF